MNPSARGAKPTAKRPQSGKGKAGGRATKAVRPKREKAKTKRSKQSGPTYEARARAAGLIDPNIKVVASDPLRVQIVSLATQRPIAPSEFAREAGIPLNVASYHFRVLRKHGFLEIVARVRVRGATKSMHIATKSGFISDADWGNLEEALKPGVAGQALQDFNNRVAQAMETGTLYVRADMCVWWAPGMLDEISWPEFVSMMAWAREEYKRFQEETVERRANGESKESFPATFAVAGFQSPTTSQLKQAERQKKRKRSAAKKKPAKAKPAGDKGASGGKDVRRPGRKSQHGS